MKKALIIFLLGLTVQSSFAQQKSVYSNYMLNEYYYNPAIAGSKSYHIANAGVRNQWTGFEGAPTTMHINYYGSYKNQMKHGYGVSLVSDKTGLMQQTGVFLNYAYHINLTDKIKMGLGVKPGYLLYNIKLYDTQLADVGDDLLTGNVLSTSALDLSSGLNVYSDKFFVRLSMHQMFGNAIKFTDFNGGLSKHFTAIAGYNYSFKKTTPTSKSKVDSTITKSSFVENLVLQPSVMINYVNPIPAQVSIMLKATYNEKIWLGLNYKTKDAFGGAVGMLIDSRFSVGYGYDYSFGQLKGYQGGTHEIMLSYITTSSKTSLAKIDEDLNNSIFNDNKRSKKNK
jgi:type IX secretion system PorP/SprF family membrane protein